jgi:hypothetical protein
VLRGEKKVGMVFVLLFVAVMRCVGGARSCAATATVFEAVPSDTADIDEKGLVLAEEKRQTLGYRPLSDAVPAIDVHDWCWWGNDRPAEDIVS